MIVTLQSFDLKEMLINCIKENHISTISGVRRRDGRNNNNISSSAVGSCLVAVESTKILPDWWIFK